MKTVYQQIADEIDNYLSSLKDDYAEQCFTFKIMNFWSGNKNIIEVKGYYKDKFKPEKQDDFILLRLFICNECNQIQISNIFLPEFMKYKGIGKRLIYNVFKISEKERYELFIIDMVNSFYQKMIKRGALPCDGCNDAVQIVSETKLF